MVTSLCCTTISTPLGPLDVAFRDKTVCCIVMRSSRRSLERECVRLFGARPMPVPKLPEEMTERIAEYLAGKRRFSGRIDLSHLTPFQQKVLHKIRTIPAGQVRSYQWVAKAIGAERAVRAVGTALARNPVPLLIPCHRVIRSDGHLGRYSGGGTPIKAKLLAFEGMDLERLAHPRRRRSIARRPQRDADRPVSAA